MLFDEGDVAIDCVRVAQVPEPQTMVSGMVLLRRRVYAAALGWHPSQAVRCRLPHDVFSRFLYLRKETSYRRPRRPGAEPLKFFEPRAHVSGARKCCASRVVRPVDLFLCLGRDRRVKRGADGRAAEPSPGT